MGWLCKHITNFLIALMRVKFSANNGAKIAFSTRIKVKWIRWSKGPFKCYVTQMGVGGGVSDFLEKSVTKV